MSTTPNATLPSSGCSVYPTADKIGKTFAFCVVSLIGNFLIGAIVIRIKPMRRTINYLILNMAMSDLILPVFAFPRLLTALYGGHWLIDGDFGLALCKLTYSMQEVSTAVSIQSLVLIAVDRFGAVVFPFRLPVVSARLCPLIFFILATWIVAMAIHIPYFFASKLEGSEENLACRRMWKEAFGESFSLKSYYFYGLCKLRHKPLYLFYIQWQLPCRAQEFVWLLLGQMQSFVLSLFA